MAQAELAVSWEDQKRINDFSILINRCEQLSAQLYKLQVWLHGIIGLIQCHDSGKARPPLMPSRNWKWFLTRTSRSCSFAVLSGVYCFI